MKYMGSKRRIAKHILPIILKDRKEEQWYVEPFVGGCNIIDKVDGNRIGNDYNKYLISFWKALQNGWLPPIHITKEEYYDIKQNKEKFPPLTLWAGICCSYGGKWFGGYINNYKENRRLKNGRLPNHQTESRNGVLKQKDKIKDVIFTNQSYENVNYPKNSIIYCDPPYESTTSYKDKFDHKKFWDWCREMNKAGHKVFISEYNAPEDFECLIEIKTNTQISNGTNGGNMIRTEKLFILKSENLPRTMCFKGKYKKKIIKNMSKRVESQDVKTDLINEIKKLPQPEKKVKPKEIKKKQGFFSKLFKKKKEVKNNDLDE